MDADLVRLPVEGENVEVEDAAEEFEVMTPLPPVTSDWVFDGLRADIAFEILQLAEEIPERISACLWWILVSPLYLFFRSPSCWAIYSSVFSYERGLRCAYFHRGLYCSAFCRLLQFHCSVLVFLEFRSSL